MTQPVSDDELLTDAYWYTTFVAALHFDGSANTPAYLQELQQRTEQLQQRLAIRLGAQVGPQVPHRCDDTCPANEYHYRTGAPVVRDAICSCDDPSLNVTLPFDDWASHIVEGVEAKSPSQLEYEIVEALQKAYRLAASGSTPEAGT